MRIQTIFAGVAAAALMAFPAMAQDGQYREPLTRIITEAADGVCLEALMAQSLLDACNSQIQGMAPALAAMGAIEEMTFMSAEDTPEGRLETWAVKFAGGEILTWVIGQPHDGKFTSVAVSG
ncbi:hypothetical protein [Brevundimonas sp. Root1423]|uniref:hypothetical protein n=1 Tax=Brevundimonas sp. Root1423 TaxID=1736462 RepID=UPI0006FBAF2A|nr:hypothetical protein [Brevundimonas sp. Root1423]KQY80454.1 hypothetical protein ASD25_10015 [Brevundimonas sp. Root1423]